MRASGLHRFVAGCLRGGTPGHVVPVPVLIAAVALAGVVIPPLSGRPATLGAVATGAPLLASTITTANAATLDTVWTGATGGPVGTSSPLAAGGTVYIGSATGVLMAFAEATNPSCAYGSPTACPPLWTATPQAGTPIDTTPALYGGEVLVSAGDQVYAYDAAGRAGCAGTPVVCTPLGSTASLGNSAMSSPLVVNGTVYVHDTMGFYAFDANGVKNCSGTPVVCTPLWSAPYGSDATAPPALSGATVLTVSNGKLYAFDANGVTNCSGTPVVCSPLWVGESANDELGVMATGGIAYTAGKEVLGYDAAGIRNCGGTPVICAPLWIGNPPAGAGQMASAVTVSGAMLYVQAFGALLAFDLGGAGCTGALPVLCAPTWSGPMGDPASLITPASAPAVYGGIVFVGSDDHRLYLFDASGTVGCTGSPAVCSPLVARPTGGRIDSTPSVDAAGVFVGSDDGHLHAFGDTALDVDVTGAALTGMSLSPNTLNMAFSPAATDYTIPCAWGANTVSLQLSSTQGSISADGQSGSSITLDATIRPNQAIVVSTALPNGGTAPVRYWVRCLPPDFTKLVVTRPGTTAAGYYLMAGDVVPFAGSYLMILDHLGVPVWYQHVSDTEVGPLPLPDGQVVGMRSQYYGGAGTYHSVMQLAGNTFRPFTVPDGSTDIHEYFEEPNGDVMAIGLVPATGDLSAAGVTSTTSYLDCLIEETSPTGRLLWEWDASRHIAMGEHQSAFNGTLGGLEDLYHCNSVDVSPDGSQVLLSIRHTSAVYDISKATGRILWKLGGNGVVGDGEQHLSIVGDPEGNMSGQHDAEFVSGNAVSLFDDHTMLPGPARGVVYRIDTVANTATMVWEHTNPSGLASGAMGSMQVLDNGNDNLIGFGLTASPCNDEVNAAGSILMRVCTPSTFSYRFLKVPPSAFSLGMLRDNAGQPPSEPATDDPGTPVPLQQVEGGYFHPVTPVRVLDTRSGSAHFGAGSTLGPGATVTVPVAGAGAIPAGASAALVNLTVTHTTAWSFLKAYRAGSLPPAASSLNWDAAGETRSSIVEVPLGATGSFTVQNAFGSADVIADVEGFVGPAAPGSGLFDATVPARICDSRSGSGTPCAGHSLGAGSVLDFAVAGAGGVPTNGVAAAVLNVTVTDTTADAGYLTCFPGGSAVPDTSDVNWYAGQTVAAQVIVPLPASGTVSCRNAAGSADVVVDVEGWFTDGSDTLATGAPFQADVVRVADTRAGSGEPYADHTIAPGAGLTITLPAIVSDLSASPVGVEANITVTDTHGPGYVVAYGSAPVPPTSTVNVSSAGETIENHVVVRLSPSSAVTIENETAGTIDVVIDLEGYYG